MADSASLVSGLAIRYATALFELAEEADRLSEVEADMTALQAALAESADLRDVVASPVFTREEQSAAMSALAEAMGLNELTGNTLRLMAAKRRLFALDGVCDAFARLAADKRGEVTAEIVSAAALSDAQLAALSASLKASVGKDVKLNVAVDEGLIGGLVVKVGSRMIDTSIRTQLANLQNVMKEVG